MRHRPRKLFRFFLDFWFPDSNFLVFSLIACGVLQGTVRTSHLRLVRHHKALAESDHENIYAISHNSVRGIDRDYFVCAKSRRITSYREFAGRSRGSSRGPA